MKKMLIAALVCAMVSSVGCDKIKDAASRDFNVKNVKFDFSAITEGAAASASAVGMRAETPNTFSVTREVNLSEIGSSDLMDYAGKISKVAVNSSLLNITASPSGSYSVANVTVKADGVSGSLLVPSYTLGGTFTAPANMNAYTSTFIMKLLSAKTITVTVSGQTDAPAGTTIRISYESDLLFTASLL